MGAADSNRRINIFINGEEVKNTVAGVRSAFDQLGREIKQTLIYSDEYNAKATEIKKLKSILDEHGNSLKNIKTGWDKMGDSIKQTALGFIGAQAVMGAFSKLVGVFKSGIDKAIQYEEEIEKLKFALHGDSEALQRMTAFANEMSKTSLFPRDKILEAETMALALGRTEDQSKKMTIAAMALSRIDPSMNLEKAMSFLNGTFGGTTKQIERLVPEIKGLTKEQYASGVAIDIIVEKYGRFATEGLETTKGKMEQFTKSWDILKINLGNFAVSTLGGLITSFAKLTTSINDAMEKDLTAEFHKQATTVVDLQNKILPLAKRYDELNGKWDSGTNSLHLNVKESKELKDIIGKIAEACPGSVKEFDKMGNAIAINTTRVRDFVNAEIARLKVMNSDAIIKEYAAMYDIRIDLEENYQHVMKQIADTGTYKINNSNEKAADVKYLDGKTFTLRNANQSEIAEMEKNYKELLEKQLGHKTQLANLNGDAILNEQKRQVVADKKEKDDLLKSDAEVLRLKKLGSKALIDLAHDTTDILEKALIDRAIKELKTDKKENNKYTLERDTLYIFLKSKIEKDYFKGKIETQSQFDRTILQMEVNLIKKHLKLKKDDYEHRVVLENELFDKQKKLKDFSNADADYMNKTSASDSDMQKENERFAEDMKKWREHSGKAVYFSKEMQYQLIELDVKYYTDKKSLSEEEVKKRDRLVNLEMQSHIEMSTKEHAAMVALQNVHETNVDKIHTKAYVDELKHLDNESKDSLSVLQEKNAEELMNIDTLEKAKALLHDKYGETHLNKFKTLDEARVEIEKQQFDAEINLQEANIKKITDLLKNSLLTGTLAGVDQDMSPEAKRKIQDEINALIKLMSDLEKKKKEGNKSPNKLLDVKKVDILGFTEEDWQQFFKNIKTGNDLLGIVMMTVDVLKSAWTSYSDLLTAQENKKNSRLEKSNNTEKEALKKKLDSHLITQTAYDIKIAALDADLQKQKDIAAYDQAMRNARLAEVNAIQQAAVASIAVWAIVPPNPVESALLEGLIVGTLAASLAAIETNMPDKPAGYAEGGYTTGDKYYRAGEDGPEWVANNDLLNDSKTAPVIAWLENYQRGNKSIPMPLQANFSGMHSAISSAQTGGGGFADQIATSLLITMNEHLTNNLSEVKKLNVFLSNPENRKARLVRDELTKFDREMTTLQSLARIG